MDPRSGVARVRDTQQVKGRLIVISAAVHKTRSRYQAWPRSILAIPIWMRYSPLMNALSFAYWLNGFAELHQEPPTPEQWKSIKEHLALVFTKVTPPVTPLQWPVGPLVTDPWPGPPKNPFEPTITCSASACSASQTEI